MEYYLATALLLAVVCTTRANEYIEYIPGTLNIILSAPHGGGLQPDEIPDRDAGCWDDDRGRCTWKHDCGQKDRRRCRASRVADYKTIELVHALREELYELSGAYPHVIINKLHRRKLDANRDRDQASFQVPAAMDAWRAFHQHIEEAKAAIGGPGLFVDVHGHGHPGMRAEFGYLIKGSKLDADDFRPAATSIRSLAARSGVAFDELLRGSVSLGALLADVGFPAVPSPDIPGPEGRAYYSGGYNTRRHGSINGGEIDAVQVESARENRINSNRRSYARGLASALNRFRSAFYSSDEEALAPAEYDDDEEEEEEEATTPAPEAEPESEPEAEADNGAEAEPEAEVSEEEQPAEASEEKQSEASEEKQPEEDAEQKPDAEEEEKAEKVEEGAKSEEKESSEPKAEAKPEPEVEAKKEEESGDASGAGSVYTSTAVFGLLISLLVTFAVNR